jgi:hypothetical protein
MGKKIDKMEHFEAFSKLAVAYFVTGERIKELEADIFTMDFLKDMEKEVASRQRELASLKIYMRLYFLLSVVIPSLNANVISCLT